MRYLTLLAAATLAVAAPASNSTLEERDFTANINFFKRWDCSDDCVENGYCLSGQQDRGMKGSDQDWAGWDDGCWDRPAGAHSLLLSISNKHGFSGIDKTCAQWKASKFAAGTFALKSGKNEKCNVFKGDKIKAVVYHW